MLARIDEGGDDIAVAHVATIVELDAFTEYAVRCDVLEGNRFGVG